MYSMYLLIDSSVKDQITLAFFDEQHIERKMYEVMNREVLTCIDLFLTEQGRKAEEIRGILVVVGTGGFSSTRIAVTVANTFGYVFQIPLLAITEERGKMPQTMLETLLRQKPGMYILPEYSAEPNITTKK